MTVMTVALARLQNAYGYPYGNECYPKSLMDFKA